MISYILNVICDWVVAWVINVNYYVDRIGVILGVW